MAVFGKYTSNEPRYYPTLDLSATTNVIVDFTSINGGTYPADGRWVSDPGPANYVPPAPPVSVLISDHGLKANRPSASALPGQRYVATDTSEEFYSDGSQWYTVGSGTYAQLGLARPRGNRWVAVGDSETAYNNSVTQAIDGWFFRMCVSSLGRIVPGGNDGGVYATAGFTLEQIQATHLPTVLALNPAPGACVVFGGTNNCGANSGGGTGTGFNLATASATLEAMCSSLIQAGIMPVLVLIPPRGDVALAAQNVDTWNTYVYLLSQRTGYPLIDAFTPMVDPATGGYLTQYTVDQVHPVEAGHVAIADYNIGQNVHLNNLPNRPVPALYATVNSLLPSGHGLFLTNTAGLGTGWSLAGGATGITTSIAAPVTADNLKGNWQHLIQAAAGNSNAWIQHQITSGWSVGDVLQFSARIRATGFSALTGINYALGLLTVGSGSSPKGIYQWTRDLADGTFSARITVPVGTTSLYVRAVTNMSNVANIAGQTDLAIGEVTVRNLTTLGLLTS